jgi:quercetin dioxygenase-like cupin family protein
VAISEINWGKTPFGPLASPVYGDFSKGNHITLLKSPAGMKTPVHTHTHDYIGVVISGVTRHYLPGKPSTMTKLPAGSHWSMPANIEHISECLPGGECIMVLYQDESFDFLPVK